MSVDALHTKSLVLNKAWQPVNTVNVKEAIGKIYSGSAKALGKDFATYDFEEWVETWSDLSIIAKVDKHKVINCKTFKIMAPEIIILNEYSGRIVQEAKLSRRNIFLRDKHTCQYCYKKFPVKQLNIDHIIPRSRDGKTTWENVALSCLPCNTKKAARTPEEAGMKLLNKPIRPKWSAMQCQMGQQLPNSWKTFIDTFYWNVSLEEKS
ncbi:MAG: HNH endonuclease [Lentisphaeraceae bacterium]|nr:HNH endonuclease [Lentisphaeraceae bacterium]